MSSSSCCACAGTAERDADRRSFWIAALAGLAGYVALAHHFAFTCDDAYITFRYAKNLALGNGLIFNPGESPPVEGYSNFLWTVALALCHALGATGGALPVAANVLTALSGAALLLLVVRLAQSRLGLDVRGTLATALFVGTLAPFGLWATGGLETMPFALALFATYERLLGDPERPRGVQAGLCAAAAGLLRADGALWVAVVLGLAGLGWLAEASQRSAARDPDRRRAARGRRGRAHLLWRHSYYGDWMPNTARVKAGSSSLRLERGLNYAVTFLLTVPAFAVLPIGALAARRRTEPALALQSVAVVVFALAYAVYVGGDFMPMGRFLLPAVPFVALQLAIVVRALSERRAPGRHGRGGRAGRRGPRAGRRLPPVAPGRPGPLPLPLELGARANGVHQWRLQRNQSFEWVWTGRALALHTSAGESLVRGPIGAVGYYTDLFIHDLNGLVSRAVAERDAPLVRASPGHDKHVEHEFFFPERPTYMGATVIDRRVPALAPLSEKVKRLMSEGKIRLERYPLPPRKGFPAGHRAAAAAARVGVARVCASVPAPAAAGEPTPRAGAAWRAGTVAARPVPGGRRRPRRRE